MKNLYFFLFTLFSASTFSQPFMSWEWQNPYPQGNTIRASEFIDQMTGFAVTDNSILMRTTDGGNTWTSHSPSLGVAQFNDVDFIDSLTGYISCNSGLVYKSQNGGLSWTMLTTGVTDNLRAIAFANSMTGFACGDNKTIVKTTNGGANWFQQSIPDTNDLYLNDIKLVNANTGYAVGRNIAYTAGVVPVYKTTNGGTNWIRFQNMPFVMATNVYIKDSNTIFVSGHIGNITRTTDGGLNWSNANYHAYASIYAISFINDSVGYAAGSDRYFLRTTNFGVSWQVINDSAFKNLNYFTISNNGNGNIYVMGTNGEITSSSNNGLNWSVFSSGVRFGIRNIQFFDNSTGYVTGDHRSLLSTTNGGSNWNIVSLGNTGGSSNHFWSMYFLNKDTGYCGYDLGQIAKTTNGGVNWLIKQLNQTRQMHAIHFTDDSTGHAAGQNNFYYRTSNAGNNWNQHFIDSGNWVGLHSDFYFLNKNTGYLSNTNGSVYKTTNGGLNWTKSIIVTDSIRGFNCITFADSLTGFTAGLKGRIAKTTNGGGNWALMQLDTAYTFNEIYTLDDQTVYLSGKRSTGGGVILKTTNGGSNWAEQVTYTSSSLNSLYFTGSSIGYAVGNAGTILKTVTAGEHPVLTGFVNEAKEITPKSFTLYQNYPNPFNPVSRIKYTLSEKGHVRLLIYDVLGRLVTTLVNKELKSGEYEVVFDGTIYPSGVYFYQLISGDFKETRKMVLVK